jgi:predicted nucleic acid-binding protein
VGSPRRAFQTRRNARKMIVSFDTNILVYATAASPVVKSSRAREVITRGIRGGSSVLLLQTVAEFGNVAIRKARIPAEEVCTIVDAWRGVLPVPVADEDDLSSALEAVKLHKLAFWDAMMWAAARRVGVRHFVTEDLQDGFELDGVNFVNPFKSTNDQLIDNILPP